MNRFVTVYLYFKNQKKKFRVNTKKQLFHKGTEEYEPVKKKILFVHGLKWKEKQHVIITQTLEWVWVLTTNMNENKKIYMEHIW